MVGQPTQRGMVGGVADGGVMAAACVGARGVQRGGWKVAQPAGTHAAAHTGTRQSIEETRHLRAADAPTLARCFGNIGPRRTSGPR